MRFALLGVLSIFLTSHSRALAQTRGPEPMRQLGEVVAKYIEDDLAVGAELLIIEKGETVFHQSFGFADREEKRKWENNTLCNIRSMTKPLTSAAAQILIDRGKLKLDVPVGTYLESFDNELSKQITVRQVLTHRSGLPLTNLMRPDQYKNLTEQVTAIGERGPYWEPGSKFWYSDIGTDVVGALVEKVSGELLNNFVQRELFDPLGMNDTLYGIDASDKRLQKAASLYVNFNRTSWNKFWTPEKPLYPFAWGSQTVYSTTTDYAKFLKMLQNGGRVGNQRILSEEAVRRMMAPVSAMKTLGSDADFPTAFKGLKTFYGQMLMTHRATDDKAKPPVIFGHSGSDGTNSWVWPKRDLVILYFTQSRGGPTALRIEGPIDELLINPRSDEKDAKDNSLSTIRF